MFSHMSAPPPPHHSSLRHRRSIQAHYSGLHYSSTLFKAPRRPTFFQDAIVVWDDVEKGIDKNIVKVLMNLRSMMFEIARHYNIHIIIVSHDLLGGNLNKTARTEVTGAFLFPQYNQPHQSRQYLSKYVGLEN